MASLARLTDSYSQEEPDTPGLPVEPLYPDVVIGGDGVPTRITVRPAEPEVSNVGSRVDKILNKLFRDDEQRYQLWPEKVIRGGLSAAGDVLSGQVPQWEVDKDTGAVHTSPQMIEKAQEMSALAGTGGIAGADATLGATPFLRPALKYKDKIYKGKPGQQHQDVIPKELYPEFEQMAMNGEDISHYNFGFMNHKGQFLDREKALEYAITEGLVDAHAGQYGALTSTLMADSSKPGTAIEAMGKTASPFYLAVERNVRAIPQDKMTGEQWLGTLSNKPGVKPEELQWTGLQDFLADNKGKPVTKEQITQHLEQNKVELKEVNKGELKFNKDSEYALPEVIKAAKEAGDNPGDLELVLANDGNAYRALTKKFPKLAEDEDWAAKVSKSVFGGDSMPAGTTKYHSYQLPGGASYREMLLTLPKKEHQAVNDFEKFKQQLELKHNTHLDSAYDVAKITGDKSLGIKYQELLAEAQKVQGESGLNYKSSHWDEPNILAHIRMNDRNIDGKKSLHMEEIQSDWHQQGRDKGYKETLLPVRNFKTYLAEEKGITDPAEMKRLWEDRSSPEGIALHNAHLTETEARAGMNIGKVPDAPFKKSWHELALKRMVREAAEKGYDRLSWTPGEAQADRYDLSKQVDKIAIPMVNKDGSRSVRIDSKTDTPFRLMIDKNGKVDGAGSADQFSGKHLSDVVGKEMADKIMKLDKSHEFSGEGLKVGGEGMKGFYDQIIPKSLEKMFKEHGVKVKQDVTRGHQYKGYDSYEAGQSPTGGNAVYGIKSDGKKVLINQSYQNMDAAKSAAKDLNAGGEVSKVHYIDIPQSLKDHALKRGFPLFSAGVPVDLLDDKK